MSYIILVVKENLYIYFNMGTLFHILNTDPISQVIPLRFNGALIPTQRSPTAATLPLSVCPAL